MNKNDIGNNKLLIGAAIIFVGIIVAFLILGSSIFSSSSSVVAVVNGENITRAEFDIIYQQIEQSLVSQGQGSQLEDESFISQIESQALDQLISQTLLLQEAKNQGHTVSQEEVDNEYERIVSQAGGEEAIDSIFEQTGLTKKVVLEDIEKQILINKYVEEITEGEIEEPTQEEVNDYYNQVSEIQEGLPPLEEVESEIISQLRQQKENEFISNIVNELSQEAEIEINL